MLNDLILATFDTAPSPHGRINAASLLLAFAHIHGEAGTPTGGSCSAVVGRNGPFLSMHVQKKGWISMQNDPILATFDITPSPHGRVNAPSLLLAFAHIQGEAGTPTGASVTRWWVGRARFCVQEGSFFPCKMTPVSPH